jgi:hypothetical protein
MQLFPKKSPVKTSLNRRVMDRDHNWAEAALKLRKRGAANYFLAWKQAESTFLSSAVTSFSINSICLFKILFFATVLTVEFKLIGHKNYFNHKLLLAIR